MDLAIHGVKIGNYFPMVRAVFGFQEEIEVLASNPKTHLEKVYLPTPCLLWKNQCIRE